MKSRGRQKNKNKKRQYVSCKLSVMYETTKFELAESFWQFNVLTLEQGAGAFKSSWHPSPFSTSRVSMLYCTVGAQDA
jgi:hypothetical protein